MDSPLEIENIRSRELSGLAAWLAKFILVALPVTGILPERIGWFVFNEQYLGLFLALALCATFILIPAGRWDRSHRVHWYDWLGALAGLVVGLYVFVEYPELANSLGDISTDRVILGCITVLLLAEACRRLVGWP
ncbi:MAG TPA: hypothetical protein VJ864_03255, partial [Candidatus Binatia bacterium]|nr:hypothetical protein [Candidatus Binatia bacterium]